MQCPNCNRDASESAQFCSHCGYALGAASPAKRPSFFKRSLVLTLLVPAALILATVGGTLARQPGASSADRGPAPTAVRSSAEAPQEEATAEPTKDAQEMPSLAQQINPPGGYPIPASFGEIGPQLLAVGAIDYERFLQVYERAGQPLTDAQRAILTEGSDGQIVISSDNAYFLLNFFWAFGLANQNPLLTEGPLTERSAGDVGRYASTGGWTIGQKPATEFLSSAPIVTLTAEQQARLETVAGAVYRPCCNNPTSFPDCNHGMAMLGLLELMAANDATEEEMFQAAKYINAYWYPQQTLEVAALFAAAEGLRFEEVDARQAVGPKLFSGSGFRALHQWLADNGLLEQMPNPGGSCGV